MSWNRGAGVLRESPSVLHGPDEMNQPRCPEVAQLAVEPAMDSDSSPLPAPSRRGFFKSTLAAAIGGLVTAFPFVAGLIPFFDPLRIRKSRLPSQAGGGADSEGYIPVGTLESLPDDGMPRLVQVVADQMDAWTFSPQQRIGSVYLRKVSEAGGEETPTVVAFQVSCPHLGCFVDFRRGEEEFFCPCHKSTFALNGRRSPESPSPRDLDPLDVQIRNGEVWVKYQEFRTSTAERIPVA